MAEIRTGPITSKDGMQLLCWVCPVCGAEHYNVVSRRLMYCLHCKTEHDKAEQEYWDNKRSGMRSVADDIISQILAGKIG